ncbi:MAG: hypothetical protein JW867_06735 [Candidatus Omnitrophica bacterium]|nr:hypothetical protein [Candidatus Omnitrophota bacterium]
MKKLICACLFLLVFSSNTFAQDAMTEATPNYPREDSAGLIMYFQDWHHIYVDKPVFKERVPFGSLDEFEAFLKEYKGDKNMAIVSVAVDSGKTKTKDLYQLKDFLIGNGFKEVFFKKASRWEQYFIPEDLPE